MAFPMLMTMVVGVSVRAWLFRSPWVVDWLASRNEISSPLTSWKRVTEGLALDRMGISPYEGDLYHEMPLMLRLQKSVTNFWGPAINICFVLMDIVLAIVLERIAKHFGRYMLQKQAKEVRDYSPNAIKLCLDRGGLQVARLYVVAVYLLNPYTIACCVAKSSAVFSNLVLALAVLFSIKGNRVMSVILIAMASYLSLYPIMLVVPAALYCEQRERANATWKDLAAGIAHTFIMTAIVLATLLYASFMMEGSWKFLESTHGFILTVPDLNPSLSLFWYFFTEMFDHFRVFFICVFQINAFIYTVPLAFTLKNDTMFMTYILLVLMSIFKSYPTYADMSLYLALLPLWKHCFPYMRNNFVVSLMFIACSILAPVLYQLWIYAGSANANFYFAITLVQSTAQIFLVTDLLFAYLRREYDLIHGPMTSDATDQPKVILE